VKKVEAMTAAGLASVSQASLQHLAPAAAAAVAVAVDLMEPLPPGQMLQLEQTHGQTQTAARGPTASAKVEVGQGKRACQSGQVRLGHGRQRSQQKQTWRRIPSMHYEVR
jgi:hypothetical protein